MADEARVFMRHPETGGVAETTQAAYDVLWQGKGWQIDRGVDATQVAHEQRVRQIATAVDVDMDKATKADLELVAGQLGRTVPPGATKDELRALVLDPVSPEDGTTNATLPA